MLAEDIRTVETRETGFSWRKLRAAAAVADLAVLALMVLSLGDTLALALALIILAGLGLLRFRGGWPGTVVLGLVSTDIAAYTITGAISNITHGASLGAVLLPAALATISLVGIVANGACLLWRMEPQAGGRAAAGVGLAALLLFLTMAGAGLLVEPADAAIAEGQLKLVTESMAYSESELGANEGQVSVTLANHDLFWHTFTIDELGLNLSVPVGAERTITFEAEPGVYEFYCSIPGHILLGMKGQLIVSDSG